MITWLHAVGKGIVNSAISNAEELSEPFVGSNATLPGTVMPLSRNITVPLGASPELWVLIVTEPSRLAPIDTLPPKLGAVMVVLAGVMLYVVLAELALKLLSPGYCACTELFPPGS